MGARHITADLGIVLRVTPDVAESVKFKYGSAVPLDVDPDEVLQVTSIGEDTSHGVTRRHIAEIVESRVSEIFKFVGAEIEAAGATNRLQAGLVLTGGGSLLAGITRAARDQLGMSARIVGPSGLGGLTDQISTPPYSAASGLLLWGARNWPSDEERAGGRPLEGVTNRIGKIFKGLMP
jgi:cell division protein FtsA